MHDLPELDYATPDIEKAAELLHKHGCLLLRNAATSGKIEPYRKAVADAYFVRDWQYAHGELEKVMPVGYYKSGALEITDLDPPQSQPCMGMVQLLNCFPLLPLYRQIFNSEIALPVRSCVIRRQAVNLHTPPVPYHQDQGFYPQFTGIEDGNTHIIINAWIPLDDCGKDAPGLEVYPQKLDTLIRTIKPEKNQKTGIYDYIEIDESNVAQHVDAARLWKPEYKVGDVMLMTNHTLHRTHMADSMTKSRTSVEIRSTSTAFPLKTREILRLSFNK